MTISTKVTRMMSRRNHVQHVHNHNVRRLRLLPCYNVSCWCNTRLGSVLLVWYSASWSLSLCVCLAQVQWDMIQNPCDQGSMYQPADTSRAHKLTNNMVGLCLTAARTLFFSQYRMDHGTCIHEDKHDKDYLNVDATGDLTQRRTSLETAFSPFHGRRKY